MEGYADRPALGQRAVEFVTDRATGRTSAQLLPRFETITYRELWDRVGAVASALADDPVRPGDRVGRARLHQRRLHDDRHGAESARRGVGSAADQRARHPTAAHRRRDRAGRDRVERRLPRRRRRADPDRHTRPRGWSCSTTAPRSTTTARRSTPPRTRLARRQPGESWRRWPTCSNAGRRCRPTPRVRHRRRRPVGAADLHLRQHRRTQGRDVPEGTGRQHVEAGQQELGRAEQRAPSITLNFMPMSHVMGRGILYGTLGNGGTAYFARQERPVHLPGGPRAGAADPVDLRAADLGHAVPGVPERTRPPQRPTAPTAPPSKPRSWPSSAEPARRTVRLRR